MLIILSEEEIKGVGKRPRLYGHICRFSSGAVVYAARRWHREIFRSGRFTISDAMGEEVASWAIDDALLYKLRAKNVSFIGVRVIDTGDVYLTRIASFFDRRRFKSINYEGVGRGGSQQRCVPIQFFIKKRGVVDLREERLY